MGLRVAAQVGSRPFLASAHDFLRRTVRSELLLRAPGAATQGRSDDDGASVGGGGGGGNETALLLEVWRIAQEEAASLAAEDDALTLYEDAQFRAG